VPEGPEIRRMVDDIDAAVGHQRAHQVFFSSRGDDGPWCVYSHNQLYGQWRIGKPNSEPRTGMQLRFAIIGPEKAARLYCASDGIQS